MRKNSQFQRMLLISLVIHITIIGALILTYSFPQKVELLSSSHDAQFVELLERSELSDIVDLPKQTQPVQNPLVEKVVAFGNMSALSPEPTPTPTPAPEETPTPTPTPEETPTPMPTPMPKLLPTPTPTTIPILRVTATPIPQRTQKPTEEPVVAWDIPRRRPVIQPRSSQEDFPIVLREIPEAPPGQPSMEQIGRAGGGQQRSSPSPQRPSGPSVMLDQTNDFPFPEYLEYVSKKIELYWAYRQGRGTIFAYFVIGRDGEILNRGIKKLKTSVDKQYGIDVEKLEESVITAVRNVPRFDPLPFEYKGMELRVIVRFKRDNS